MVNLGSLYHPHRRKRIHQKHEPYPHTNKLKRAIDRIIYAIIFIGPIMTIPQVTNIWIDHNAGGVSAISWFTYLIVACFWLFYGSLHKEKPIIVSATIWIFLDILIVIGTLIYG